MSSLLLYCGEPTMKIIIDERETALFDLCNTLLVSNNQVSSNIQISKEVLNLGDILLKTDDDKEVLLIERKSLQDLLASIKDNRYEEQSYRLIHSSGFPPHSIFYLVEGVYSQLRSQIEKKIIMSSMTSMQFFKGFSVHRTASIQESAQWLMFFADKIQRNFSKGIIPYYLTDPFLKHITGSNGEPKTNTLNNITETENITVNNDENTENVPIFNGFYQPSVSGSQQQTTADYCHVVKKVKKENITPENIGEIILCQIPGISSITAIAIMKHFNHFTHFIEEITKDFSCIENLTIESNGKVRKISKKSIESIQQYLLNNTK
jgi:ERCC4-type nuclease